MDEPEYTPGLAGRIGGALCLDFVNTVDWHGAVDPGEHLREYADLVRWAKDGGLLTSEQAARCVDIASYPAGDLKAQAVLAEACSLRDALYRILVASIQDAEPQQEDLSLLNSHISSACSQARLVRTETGFTWGWQALEGHLDAPLWPVVRSAVTLLSGPHLSRVRRCADSACGWLFLDSSKNHSRRWCSMEGCGSRAKARNYYLRKSASMVSVNI